MSREADRDVWLNFLDEVDEYLSTIESVIVGLADTGADSQQMDAALRAIHTIKGIGSMIECPPLSHLAHRLEDALKIVKVRRGSIQVDASLEMLLLQGVDSLRQVSSRHRNAFAIDDAWLAKQADPIFECLHDRLGELQHSDELALLSEESNTDMAVVMFDSEVAELLKRLESVLATPQLPCLREELELMAEELIDLGQMLQLEAFTSLSLSIQQRLASATPDQVESIARQALVLWQRSQALVIVGKLDKLPTQFEQIHALVDAPQAAVEHSIQATPTDPLELAASSDWPSRALESFALEEDASAPVSMAATGTVSSQQDRLSDPTTANSLSHTSSTSDPDGLVTPAAAALVDSVFADGDAAPKATSDLSETFNPISLDDVDLAGLQTVIENVDLAELADLQVDVPFAAPESEPISLDIFKDAAEQIPTESQMGVFVSPYFQAKSDELLDVVAEAVDPAPSVQTQDSPENTVRVPCKLLTQLNDLFGELMIQRNTLNLRLEHMQEVVTLWTRRMDGLVRTNARLQAFCNQLEIEAAAPDFHASHALKQPLLSHSRSLVQWSDSQQIFDSLELDRYSNLSLLSQEQREYLVQLQEVASDAKHDVREITQASNELNRTVKALQLNVTQARMRPLSDIVGRFSRTVRELSLRYGKAVDLKIYGGATLIDRFVAEQLRDPLLHLLRNAFDHGIEDPETRKALGKPPQGTIEILATQQGNQTLISISDDGAGINLDKIRDRAYRMGLNKEWLNSVSKTDLLSIIFEPGFSTADEVTDLSGRGIGMDVVRTNLEQIRGEVEVDTQPGLGTRFTISVPFTLSIMRVLLIENNGIYLAFPTVEVEEMIRLKTLQTRVSLEQAVINLDGLIVPLVRLDRWLEFHCQLRPMPTEKTPIIEEPSVLLVRRRNGLSGIYFDRFWGEREVVIRQVENLIDLPTGFNGCAILEDGRVVPLASANKLLDWIDNTTSTSTPPPRLQPLAPHRSSSEDYKLLPSTLPQPQQPSILVVDDSVNMRQLLTRALEKAGYCVEQAKDGQDALEQLLNGLSPQAIVCDIEMPRLDGYGLLAEVRIDSQWKDLPVVMLTSRSGEKHRQLAMNLGATAYVTKPYQEYELLQTIEQMLQP